MTAGVVLHLPMFLMARAVGYRPAGMTEGDDMLAGMALVVAGIGATAYGLAPPWPDDPATPVQRIGPAETAPLTGAHWTPMLVLTAALVIDLMKPASLGSVVSRGYGIPGSSRVLAGSAIIGLLATGGLLVGLFGRETLGRAAGAPA